MTRSLVERVATRPARPGRCTWATSGRPCWPGCSPDRPGGGSCSGSRTSTPAGSARGGRPADRRPGRPGARLRPAEAGPVRTDDGVRGGPGRTGRPHVRVLLHPPGDRRGGQRAARHGAALPGHLPGPDVPANGRSGGGPGRRRCGCGPTGPSRRSPTCSQGTVAGGCDDIVVRRNDGVRGLPPGRGGGRRRHRGRPGRPRRRPARLRGEPGLPGPAARLPGADVRARAAGGRTARAGGWPSGTAR